MAVTRQPLRKTKQKTVQKPRRSRWWAQLTLQISLALFAVAVLLPFLWMLSVALKARSEVFLPGINLIPREFTLEHFGTALNQAPIFRFLLNGVVVVVGTLVMQLLVIIPAGYAFGRMQFAGKRVLFGVVLAGLVVPAYVTAIPNFLLFADLGFRQSDAGTFAALILPFVGSAFGIFLMRQFFRQLPQEVLDAARIDGCNVAQAIWYVFLPLIRPAIAAFAVFSIVTHWNDFFWPFIVINRESMYTPPAAIFYFEAAAGETGDGANAVGTVMAAAIYVIAPLIITFLLARKQFIESLASSAVKG